MYLCNAFPISKKNTDWNDHFEVDRTSQKGSHMKTAKEWALFSLEKHSLEPHSWSWDMTGIDKTMKDINNGLIYQTVEIRHLFLNV